MSIPVTNHDGEGTFAYLLNIEGRRNLQRSPAAIRFSHISLRNKMSNAIITRPTDKVMNVNISYADMQRPVQGPEDPFNQKKNKGMNSLAGE